MASRLYGTTRGLVLGVGRIGEIAAQFAQEQAVLAMAPGDDRFACLHKGAHKPHVEASVEGLQQGCEKGTQVPSQPLGLLLIGLRGATIRVRSAGH
jgi:hypothetical protein